MDPYKAPRPPKGEHEVTLYPDWANDEPVVCHFEYVPGEPMTRDAPGCAEELNLTCAYIRGWDCYRILGSKQIADLEEQILARHNELEYEP
jgi:hypothetical protein